LKAGDSDNFFINVFSGFTDLIDGIILNMKFGGCVRSFLVVVGGGYNIMFVSVKERQTNGFKNHWAQKTDSYYFSFI
jgi:putative ABC transport system permease protein